MSEMKAFVCVLLCFTFLFLLQDCWKSEVKSSGVVQQDTHSGSSHMLGGMRVVSLSVSSLLCGWTVLADLLKLLILSPWMILSAALDALLISNCFCVGLVSSVSWLLLQAWLYVAHVSLMLTAVAVLLLAALWAGRAAERGLKH